VRISCFFQETYYTPPLRRECIAEVSCPQALRAVPTPHEEYLEKHYNHGDIVVIKSVN
jgi:hypothetical protein